MKETELRLSPAEAHNEEAIKRAAAFKLNIPINLINHVKIIRRSIDARGRDVVYQLRVAVYTTHHDSPPKEVVWTKETSASPEEGDNVADGMADNAAEPALLSHLKNVENGKKVIIIGAGPAGYFAALELIEQGLKPLIFDRGKDVRARRRDLKAIQQLGLVNPHSNYCFGEGGAGTYSDGKLYTRSHKRGSIEKALTLLVEHGATSDILIDAHPHIGSNKLPLVVQNIRETIVQYGGEVHFDSFVTDFIIRDKKIKGITVNDKDEYFADAVIVATGHSARDIYYLCHRRNIRIEAKPFALGVRIEHTQEFVDSVQYKTKDRGEYLPAASYSLVCQVQNRGVFSFCMCPGGLVVPASTAPGEIVVNGMSMSRRDSAFANSGTVVAIELEDLVPFSQYGEFQTLEFQKSVEQKMFSAGDGTQKAPAQRLTDFVNRQLSADLPPTSYIPGLISAPMHELLPPSVYRRLREGVMQFGKMMKGYMTENANVIGTESRTSSPVRIPRNAQTFMHDDCEGFFPCGEGAGYAGGIISAAIDGQNVAKKVAAFFRV